MTEARNEANHGTSFGTNGMCIGPARHTDHRTHSAGSDSCCTASQIGIKCEKHSYYVEEAMKEGDKVTLRGVVGDKLGDLVYVRSAGGGSAILVDPKLLEIDTQEPSQSVAPAQVPPYARK